jgi:hypothetical protein
MTEAARILASDRGDQAAAKPTLDTEVKAGGTDFATALQAIAKDYGRPLQQVVMEIARLSFGPGKVSFDEYMALRLFDDAGLGGADKSAFAGLKAAQSLWLTANADPTWFGIVDQKLAITTLLAGYGLPTIPTAALFAPGRRYPAVTTLGNADDLAQWLRHAAYPLFGKPVSSNRSLGSASLVSFDADRDAVTLLSGERVALTTFCAEVAAKFAEGYLLQPRVEPHPAAKAICGDRLACVRVMTISGDSGPEVLRAVWKIPAGDNVADNFWRGNILCQIDLETGRVMRAITGTGLACRPVETHPDTGAMLSGIEVPGWSGIIDTALAGAGALPDVPLIGWDIAATKAGAVIVEPNNTPDLFMVQLADRRGIMDSRFKAFLAHCEMRNRERATREREQRRFANAARMGRLGQQIKGS